MITIVEVEFYLFDFFSTIERVRMCRDLKCERAEERTKIRGDEYRDRGRRRQRRKKKGKKKERT